MNKVGRIVEKVRRVSCTVLILKTLPSEMKVHGETCREQTKHRPGAKVHLHATFWRLLDPQRSPSAPIPKPLAPIVVRVGKTLVHHRFKAGVLLDEDVGEVPVLAQQNGLKPHQLKQRQEHGNQRPLRTGADCDVSRPA